MKFAQGAVAVAVAPLIGALVWMSQTIFRSIQQQRIFGGPSLLESGLKDPAGLLSLVGFGWLYGLTLTILVGLPIGFAVAYLLRRFRRESLAAYCMTATVAAFAFSMLLPGRAEFWLPITVTGFVLGICYWQLIRRSALRPPEAE